MIFDDLVAEQEALDAVLVGLSPGAWRAESAAPGWTVADVVLHMAQSEEILTATVAGSGAVDWRQFGSTVDQAMDVMVRAERASPREVLERWRSARRAALAGLVSADPERPIHWVVTPLKPRTLATTRLAEHWAHALDVTGPLGIDHPDTARLRHIAWLGHTMLPYAFALAGQPPQAVRCELTAPDGSTWQFGPPEADSSIVGPASEFCRLGAQRLALEQTSLVGSGPSGLAALRVLRTYAR